MLLRVLADWTLFWPGTGGTFRWPNLEHLHVEFRKCTPSGSWYFIKTPELIVKAAKDFHTVVQNELYLPLIDTETDRALWEETYEMDALEAQTTTLQFRAVPNDTTIVPFLTTFAKVAAQMPRLKAFALWSLLTFSLDVDDEGYSDLDFSIILSIPKHFLNPLKLAWGIAYTTNTHQKPFSGNDEVESSVQRQIW